MTTESPNLTEAPQLELLLSSAPADGPSEDLGFKITNTGLVITNEDMTIEGVRRGLQAFKLMKGRIDLARADFINWARLKHGKEVIDQELAQLEFDLQDVKAAVDIATVPVEIRQPGLLAEHYIILGRCKGTLAQKRKWAITAAIRNLSPGQLKASINVGEVVSGATAAQQQHGLSSAHGINQEFSIWLRRVKGVKGILAMDPAARDEIIGELEPIGKAYAQLIEARSKLKDKPAKKPSKKPSKKK